MTKYIINERGSVQKFQTIPRAYKIFALSYRAVLPSRHIHYTHTHTQEITVLLRRTHALWNWILTHKSFMVALLMPPGNVPTTTHYKSQFILLMNFANHAPHHPYAHRGGGAAKTHQTEEKLCGAGSIWGRNAQNSLSHALLHVRWTRVPIDFTYMRANACK